MPGPAQPEGQAPGAGLPAREETPPRGLAYLDQAAQQAQLRQYGVLAALGQHALSGMPLPRLAHESLLLLLESLALSQGALLELLPGEPLRCVASFGLPLAPGAPLQEETGPWRAVLAEPLRTAHVFGLEAPLSLEPLGAGAQGLLVRVPAPSGVSVALLALALPPGQHVPPEARPFLEAAAHLLGAAISREREAQAEREVQAGLEALLAFSPTAICLKDLMGRYRYANTRFASYLGRTPQEVVGREDKELFPADTVRDMALHEEAVRALGAVQEHEERWTLPQGRLTFMAVRFPLRDAQGRTSATGLVAVDITGEKRIEQELRQQEEQLRLLVEGLAGHAIFMLDPEGRVASWNRGAERLKGYKEEEVLGAPVHGMLAGRDANPEAVRHVLARAQAEGRAQVQTWCVRKDGSRFVSSDTLQPLWTEEGRLRGFSVVSEDITERRRAERQLEHSETRYRLVSRATHEAIWDWDLARNHVEWGEWAMQHLGYPEGEAGHHPSWWEARIHPDDRERVLSGLVHVIEGGGEHWRAEYRFLRANGSWASILDSGYVVHEKGRPRRVIGAMADISRRKRAEEERTRLYREAQEAIRARDEFLSVASHELKTPLTTLQLHLQMLHQLARKGGEAFSAERAAARLLLVERQAQRLAKLVNDLLDISRIASGRMELRYETVQVASLVQELVQRQQEALGRSGSQVRLQVKDVRVARVDPMRLEQVLTNLLSNAAKYGQGRPIDVTLEGDDSGYLLRVRDRGIGISPGDQRRIFERFERAVSERHYGGLGLGLWIARQIVMNLGGTIEVESAPGEGATFEVRLPRFPPEASLTELAGSQLPT